MDLRKLYLKLLQSPNNVRFADFVKVIEAFGFVLLRVSGSHHIFGRSGITELINVQNVGGKAKPYQIRQFLKIVEKYNLTLND